MGTPAWPGKSCGPGGARWLSFLVVSEKAWERLKRWGQDPGTVAISTDIDGVLAPIVPTPDMSEVPEELRELLRRLSERYLVVAGVSGRAAEDAAKLVGLKELVYYGNHGFEILRSGEVEAIPEAEPYRAAIEELEAKAREELEPLGAFVEEKGITASVHYRNVSPQVRADKGTAVRRLVEEYRARKALFIGDDTTDLDAFRELEGLREEGVLAETLRIGVASDEGPPEIRGEADLVVDGVEGVGG